MKKVSSKILEKYIVKNRVKFTKAVVCFLIDSKRKKVLLGQRIKVSNDLGKDKLAGIGGKVGDHEEFKNETVEDAVVRELEEEIKVKPTKFENMGNVRFINPTNPKWDLDVDIFVVTEWEGKPTETDVIRPEWFDIDNLPEDRMWRDNLLWLPRVLRGEKVKGIFLFYRDKNIEDKMALD